MPVIEPKEIVLTKAEMMVAALVGGMRNITAIEKPNANGFSEEFGWNVHVEGVCGEMAGAKALGRYWPASINTFDAPDIGKTIQVRTRSRHDYELYVRPKDNPDYAYLLVTGKAPLFVVRGYCIGRHAQRNEWKKTHGDRPPAWFVPNSELWDWRELSFVSER
jgi:hypothetical protein